MKLIVGLGNPDREYQNTYHNLGFMTADAVAQKLNIAFSKKTCRAEVAEFGYGKNKILIAKPQTYMNLSGESVRELLDYYKIDVCDLLVIYDDFDLEQGAIRFRASGSAGTHNGMRNIIKEIKSQDFARVRIGFKPTTPSQIPLIDFVLSKIPLENREIINKAILYGADCAIDFSKGLSAEMLMQKYNGKR